MADRRLSGRQMMELFYTEVERPPLTDGIEEEVDAPTLFRCKCGKTRAQRLKHGYTNLVQHVLVKHSDWVAAASREAHPSPVPALANGDKSPTPPKKNGKARARAETGEAEINGTALGNNDTVGDSSEDETKPETQEPATIQQVTASVGAQKRSDYLSWDDYFMSVAFLSAMRSKAINDVGVAVPIQSGIARVVYCSDKYNSDWKFVASRRLLDMAGVQYTQHKLQLSKLVIDFTSVM
ncbi:E3 ubiquitin ligase complex SCF subunit scon-3 [Phytophthora nicotianae]|uniref:E3 ubiquitin ligase complex SCF subunit scon-3 n=1 Tax=Phytophthora nicotianae TaxID=4792 RepID=A0A0W8DQC4_PHYNI|nr:E3 ubiquitin ligase complex SCF subunit scon-3 [Phytophthora nicotianae]